MVMLDRPSLESPRHNRPMGTRRAGLSGMEQGLAIGRPGPRDGYPCSRESWSGLFITRS